MLLAIVYGVYALGFSSAPQPDVINSDQEQKALKEFIIKVAEKTKNSLSNNQAYVLQKAQADWKRDPFIQIEPEKPDRREQLATGIEIQYKIHRFFTDG